MNPLTLKKSNCKNCYKCIRHCPVKSIRFSGNQAHIMGDDCILCGQCFVVCPQNAKDVADETEKVQAINEQISDYVQILANKSKHIMQRKMSITTTVNKLCTFPLQFFLKVSISILERQRLTSTHTTKEMG